MTEESTLPGAAAGRILSPTRTPTGRAIPLSFLCLPGGDRSATMTEQLRLHIEEVDEVRPLWEGAMTCAGRRLGSDVVESWLREAEPLSLRDGVLTLGAPNGTARDWIDKKYGAAIAAAFQEANGRDIRVLVVVRPVSDGVAPSPTRCAGTRPVALSLRPPVAPSPPPEAFAPIPLNDKYTFDRFVV